MRYYNDMESLLETIKMGFIVNMKDNNGLGQGRVY